MAVEGLAGEVAVWPSEGRIEKRAAHQGSVLRCAGADAVLRIGEGPVEHLGEKRVGPAQHGQLFGNPAIDAPDGVCLQAPADVQPGVDLRPGVCWGAGQRVEAQTRLVGTLSGIGESPCLNVECRMLDRCQRGDQRSP